MAERLPPVSACMAYLLGELALRPRRLASSVPVTQRTQHVRVVQKEASNHPAAHLKCREVSVLARYGRRKGREIALGTSHGVRVRMTGASGSLGRPLDGLFDSWEVVRLVRPAHIGIGDRDRDRGCVFVIQKSRQARGLRAGRCRQVSVQLVREVSLKVFDREACEAAGSPQDVHSPG